MKFLKLILIILLIFLISYQNQYFHQKEVELSIKIDDLNNDLIEIKNNSEIISNTVFFNRLDKLELEDLSNSKENIFDVYEIYFKGEIEIIGIFPENYYFKYPSGNCYGDSIGCILNRVFGVYYIDDSIIIPLKTYLINMISYDHHEIVEVNDQVYSRDIINADIENLIQEKIDYANSNIHISFFEVDSNTSLQAFGYVPE